MKDSEIIAKRRKICGNIATRKLKPAFDMIGDLISEHGLGIYYDEYRNLVETYRFMLKYTVEGTSDPERQKVYHKLIVSAFGLADKIIEALNMKYSSSVEYEKKRNFKNSFITDLDAFLKELEDFYIGAEETQKWTKASTEEESYAEQFSRLSGEEKEAAGEESASQKAAKIQKEKIERLFYHIWFSDKLSAAESKQWKKFMFSNVLPVSYKALLTTGVMLSLQRFFDPEKFVLLFDTYGSEEPEINQRALTGLLICFYKYDQRMSFYPDITGRVKILNENPGFKRNLERIIIQLIRSKETEKLQQRIRDEILPEMIKISPNLKKKINLDSLMEEGLSEDKNPDWEDIFKDSPELMSKMEEFSEMQMKGDDVFMGSFSMLKSFPFFNKIPNWFMPFFTDNPELSENLGDAGQTARKMVEAVEQVPILCNSDKYSLCFSIERLPKENLDFMAQAMQAESEQMKEIKSDEELSDSSRNTDFVSNRYIQDLYRFYKLYPRKEDFEDIFSWRLDFHNKHELGGILREDLKVLRNIGEYYFAKEHYDEADEIFSYLLEHEKNGELFQKIAWCHQKRGDFSKALDNYLKAELFEVNQLWNFRKTALCYRNLKKPDKALEYYKAAEKLDPENLGIHLNIGHCLLELEKYDEALQCYFKVEYLAPGNKKVWRPIAWCSFLTGKTEQAEKYLLKLMEEDPNKHDLLNMGHVQWSLGNRKSALDYYKRSITKKDGTREADQGKTGEKASSYEGPARTQSGKGSGEETKKGSAKAGPGKKESTEEGFSESEFFEVFEEDIPHLIERGIDSDDIPIMLDQLRFSLEE